MYLHGMRWQAREWDGRRVGLLRVYCTSCVAVRHATFTCNKYYPLLPGYVRIYHPALLRYCVLLCEYHTEEGAGRMMWPVVEWPKGATRGLSLALGWRSEDQQN